MKICPFVDRTKLGSHTIASREDLEKRLEDLWGQQDQSPFRDLFQKTFTYFTALRRQGCASPLYEPTIYIDNEALVRKDMTARREKEQRGHSGKVTCDGRLLLRYSGNGQAFIQ